MFLFSYVFPTKRYAKQKLTRMLAISVAVSNVMVARSCAGSTVVGRSMYDTRMIRSVVTTHTLYDTNDR